MKKNLNKILFLVLGIVFIPSFAGATVSTKLLSEANGSITCRTGVEGSIAKNSLVTWKVGDLSDYGELLISWSGLGVNGASTQSVDTSYSTSGLVDDVSVTLEDESGPLTIKCDTLKVQKTLSEDIGTNNLTCSTVSSITKNTSVTWGINGFNNEDYGPILISWSGSNTSGNDIQSVVSGGYSNAGLIDDVSVTLEDESGPLTIKCNSLNVLKSLSDFASSTDILCSPTESFLAKNITADWGISGLENYGPVLISWSGAVSGNTATVSKIGGYSIAGLVPETSITLEDESLNGPLTIKCNPLTIKKSLSDVLGTDTISCSPSALSLSKNTSVTWGLSGINFDEFGPIIVNWSGTGVSGITTQSATNISGYSTLGTANDVSITLEDESGPLTIKCNPLDITGSTSGGSSGGGSVGNTCKLVGNIDGDRACDADILDFNLLMLNWGSTVSGNDADLNNDDKVDILDLNILMLNWTGTL